MSFIRIRKYSRIVKGFQGFNATQKAWFSRGWGKKCSNNTNRSRSKQILILLLKNIGGSSHSASHLQNKAPFAFVFLFFCANVSG